MAFAGEIIYYHAVYMVFGEVEIAVVGDTSVKGLHNGLNNLCTYLIHHYTQFFTIFDKRKDSGVKIIFYLSEEI